MNGVLVILEYGGAWNRISWEALAAGQEIAAQIDQPLMAAVAGGKLDDAAAELAGKPLARAFAVRHALLRRIHRRRIRDRARAAHTGRWIRLLVLFPHTYQVRDFAPRLATRFGQTLIADVIAHHASRPAGRCSCASCCRESSMRITVHAGAGPCFVSIQAGAFRADAIRAPASLHGRRFHAPAGSVADSQPARRALSGIGADRGFVRGAA